MRCFEAPSKEQGLDLPPSMGLQFFGLAEIDGRSMATIVRLMDVADNELFQVALEPERG